MDLFVIRHALAEERRPGLSDAERVLTVRGRRRQTLATTGLQRLGLSFDSLRHSPLARAVQTAELLVPLLQGPCRATEALARPPGPELLEELEGERAALVGHEPWMGELVAWLLLGTPDAGGAFRLGKGGLAWLEGEPRPGGMRLRALFTPRALRCMACG
ncbi:MAG: histidine phosphatase family protein [Deltaproteobacteria bacterium]|jgi:phosphohistidine phosphatase|nr:histidine phosphatase family protein [Deltaproteobacteria bacterium]MBW2533739.1 histidine phosphatase family protein [Deltaproteobacteria bacterium]